MLRYLRLRPLSFAVTLAMVAAMTGVLLLAPGGCGATPTNGGRPSTRHTATSTQAASSMSTTATASSAGQEIVYVANAGADPVAGYNAQSSGAVAPVREADNPHNSNTVWDPWGVAIDRAGDIYVQSFLSDASTFVFGPNPMARSAPIRIFRVYGPDSRAIAVDGEGYEYVASGESGSLIAVAPPGATGSSGNLYSVAPVRTFATSESLFIPWPDILATSGHDLLVATANSAGNAVATYSGGAGASATALRILTGESTGLGSCASTCDHVSIACSPASTDLYAAVSGGEESHISVFAGSVSGNQAPLRTIQGSATGLAGKVITGIAVSQDTGDIYVMVKLAEFAGAGQIEVFGGEASGNVAPLRTFTDAENAFAQAMGIAIVGS